MTDEELKAKLLEVESGKGSGDYTSNWHRNPEGPQAVARIEELESAIRDISQRSEEFEKKKEIQAAIIRGQDKCISHSLAHTKELEETIFENAAKYSQYYRGRTEELEAHIQVLLDNDPDDPIEGGGCPLIDLWRHVAKDLLKGTDHDK